MAFVDHNQTDIECLAQFFLPRIEKRARCDNGLSAAGAGFVVFEHRDELPVATKTAHAFCSVFEALTNCHRVLIRDFPTWCDHENVLRAAQKMTTNIGMND